MINFRFHLISLIAVFLALAVGVVMGYGVLGQPTVDTLQSRVDTVEARADEIRGENDRLRTEQARLESVLREVDEFAATNRLTDASVVPVAVRGVDSEKVADTVRLARRAGGTAPGIVWLDEKWSLTNDDDLADLAAIVGSTSTSRAAVRADAAGALATRLATGTTTGRNDLLVELDDAGFISLEEVDDVVFDPARFDGRVSRILVLGGNAAELPMAHGVEPLVRALVEAGRIVVVADQWAEVEDGPARGDELAPLLDDADLGTLVATIDNFDAPDGPLTAVLVLADRGRGVIGHYGFGTGAERAVPAWWGV